MNDFQIIKDAKTLASAIREAFPDAEEALADSIEGEGLNITDALYRVLLRAEDRREQSLGISARMKELKERKDRVEDSEEKLRRFARDAMETCGIRKIDRPELSAWLVPSPPAVIITDLPSVPQDYLTFRDPEPNKLLIKKALKDGFEVPGAVLSNTTTHLTVRRT